MSPAIWLAMARDDLRAAELLVEHGLPPLSRMHADHAVEKALRAFHLHRERQADEELAGSTLIPMFPYPSVTVTSNHGAELSRRAREHPLPSGLGDSELASARGGWIAAALAGGDELDVDGLVRQRSEHPRGVAGRVRHAGADDTHLADAVVCHDVGRADRLSGGVDVLHRLRQIVHLHGEGDVRKAIYAR